MRTLTVTNEANDRRSLFKTLICLNDDRTRLPEPKELHWKHPYPDTTRLVIIYVTLVFQSLYQLWMCVP